MRKLICMLLLLSLTGTWATAALAVYCGHEIAASDQSHLGHHGDDCTESGESRQQKNSTDHAHCSITYLFSHGTLAQGMSNVSHPLFAHVAAQSVYILQFSSVVPQEPERPKWPLRA